MYRILKTEEDLDAMNAECLPWARQVPAGISHTIWQASESTGRTLQMPPEGGFTLMFGGEPDDGDDALIRQLRKLPPGQNELQTYDGWRVFYAMPPALRDGGDQLLAMIAQHPGYRSGLLSMLAGNNTVVFDLDGTLANCDERRKHLLGDRPNWGAFNRDIGTEKVNWPVARLSKALRDQGNSLVICSGRGEEFRRQTEIWLTFAGIRYEALYMRPEKDQRPDHVVKLELYHRIIKDGYDPWMVVDDRDSVVEMWRAMGLTCMQCAPGDF